MTKAEIIRFLILRTIGNFLLLFAIFGVVATFGPALYYEVQFRLIQIRGVHFVVAKTPQDLQSSGSLLGDILERERIARQGGLKSVLAGPKEQILIPKDPYFSILIPKFGANTQVFANIDPGNEREFLPVLQMGVAHARGTVFPGISGNIYLFAHSTDNFWDAGRYNAIFYLIKDLAIGDDIVVFFENRRHNYKVSESKIVDASEVSYIVKSQEQKQETLILQTCWPPGTTWKRLVVLAKPK